MKDLRPRQLDSCARWISRTFVTFWMLVVVLVFSLSRCVGNSRRSEQLSLICPRSQRLVKHSLRRS